MDDRKNNQRDYSEFYKEDKRDDKVEEQKEHHQERTSYYYSYGPFKSSNHQDSQQVTTGSESNSDSLSSTSVEVTPPRYVSAYTPDSYEQKGSNNNAGGYPRKRRSSFRSMFASFLVGVLTVGSLMIASDKMDLFTADENVPSQGQLSYSNLFNANENTGEASNVAMDIVRPDSIADIVKRSEPAVVKIETVVNQASSNNRNFNDQFFREFFGDSFRTPDQESKRSAGMGSGFIFEKNGYILTNEHVLSGADEIYVTVQGYPEPFKAELLGSDYGLDLAVLKIEGDHAFPTIKLGDSSALQSGDWLIAIGNPIGFDHTVSVGVLSANERGINIPDPQSPQGSRIYKHLLQTDAAINPGNSGGPLINLNGEVIGINTAVSTQAQGIGFAIPTSTIVEVLDKLKNNEDIPKPYIGVGLYNIDATWMTNLNLQSTDGTVVTQIEDGSPASKAGLQLSDVIVGINNKKIKNTQELIDIIQDMDIGERVTMEIIRDGKKVEAVVIIGDRNKL